MCRERGSAAPLVVGFAVVIVLLIAAVTDATSAFLARQRLETLAEGAALRGADLGVADARVYAGVAPGRRLVPAAGPARRAVADYLTGMGASASYPGLTTRVEVDPVRRSVAVRLCAVVDLPLRVPGVAGSTTVCGSARGAVAQDE